MFGEKMMRPHQVQRYELQIFEVSSFLRSVLLTGQTTDGRSYQRCVLGNALLVGNLDMKQPIVGWLTSRFLKKSGVKAPTISIGVVFEYYVF